MKTANRFGRLYEPSPITHHVREASGARLCRMRRSKPQDPHCAEISSALADKVQGYARGDCLVRLALDRHRRVEYGGFGIVSGAVGPGGPRRGDVACIV